MMTSTDIIKGIFGIMSTTTKGSILYCTRTGKYQVCPKNDVAMRGTSKYNNYDDHLQIVLCDVTYEVNDKRFSNDDHFGRLKTLPSLDIDENYWLTDERGALEEVGQSAEGLNVKGREEEVGQGREGLSVKGWGRHTKRYFCEIEKN
eukprot:8203193-Ditylum_brightwellii.AAC.1